jgi:hypothetical protein
MRLPSGDQRGCESNAGPEELEDDRFAVWRDVERHPGSFRCLEIHRPSHFQRQRIEFDLGGIALCRVLRRRGRWLLYRERGSDKQGKHGGSGWKNDGVLERPETKDDNTGR